MKKMFLAVFAILCVAQISSAQQVTIDMDFGGGTGGTLVVREDGMTVEFGQRHFARRRIQMRSGTLRIGSEVITRAGDAVKIVGMNPTSRAIKVQYWNGTIREANLENLGVTNGCNQVFCVGEELITRAGDTVTVAAFFADGTVSVRYWNGTVRQSAVENLGLTNACSDMLCSGDKVITRGNDNVEVAAFYMDGTVSIRYWNGSVRNADVSGLSLTQAVCANIYVNRVGLCY